MQEKIEQLEQLRTQCANLTSEERKTKAGKALQQQIADLYKELVAMGYENKPTNGGETPQTTETANLEQYISDLEEQIKILQAQLQEKSSGEKLDAINAFIGGLDPSQVPHEDSLNAIIESMGIVQKMIALHKETGAIIEKTGRVFPFKTVILKIEQAVNGQIQVLKANQLDFENRKTSREVSETTETTPQTTETANLNKQEGIKNKPGVNLLELRSGNAVNVVKETPKKVPIVPEKPKTGFNPMDMKNVENEARKKLGSKSATITPPKETPKEQKKILADNSGEQFQD